MSTRNRVKLFPVLLLFCILCFKPVTAPAQQLPPEDVVFLIDSSESAAPFLPSIAGIVGRFIAGAAAGDSFTCYQFSNNPVLIAKGTIGEQSDIANLQAQLRQLHPSGLNTNYSPAFQRGLSGISQFSRQSPDHKRLLMLITDGRSPTDGGSEKVNLESLLRSFADIKNGSEFFFTCFYLGERVEPDLHYFLSALDARLVYWPKDEQWLQKLTLGEIVIADENKDLGQVPEAPGHMSFTLSFVPRRPPAKLAMVELGFENDFSEQTLDRLFDVRPHRTICQKQPWTETFQVETRGFGRGEYKGRFLFDPSEPQDLLVYPYSIAFHFSVSQSLRIITPQPLIFGPTGLKGDYQETKLIHIRSQGDDFPNSPASIGMLTEIELPEGLHLTLSPVLAGKEITVTASLSRERGTSTPVEGEYKGIIKFISPDGWLLDRYELPVSVRVQKKPISYHTIALYAGGTAAGGVLLVIVLLLFSNLRKEVSDYVAHLARPAGKLFVLKDPSRELAQNINLTTLAKKNPRKAVLLGGFGEGTDVELKHISMVDKIFEFTGSKTGAGIQTFVKAQKGAEQVLLNGIPRAGKISLKHMDHLKLGSYEFRYEEPLLLHQVVLYFLSGEVQQGWLLDWNPASEAFRLLKRDKVGDPAEAHVLFSQLKAVAFVRDFEGEVTKNLLSLKMPKTGHLARIIFADQEEITGYIFNWSDPGEKFYLFPDEMGQNVLFLLIERHTLKEIKLLKENEDGAKRAQKQFEEILRKMAVDFKMPV